MCPCLFRHIICQCLAFASCVLQQPTALSALVDSFSAGTSAAWVNRRDVTDRSSAPISPTSSAVCWLIQFEKYAVRSQSSSRFPLTNYFRIQTNNGKLIAAFYLCCWSHSYFSHKQRNAILSFWKSKRLFLTADVYRFLKFPSNSLHNSISWPGDLTSGVISPLGILTRCRLSLNFLFITSMM
jgi:hypothetical protein